uniref:Uncharacterized protein n=1 Tax=Ralstonia solanacearum TaxID=305 RepID=A0A0S4X3U9_RALSL|nr:protein of unknown function [Ralstonia solanacearum]
MRDAPGAIYWPRLAAYFCTLYFASISIQPARTDQGSPGGFHCNDFYKHHIRLGALETAALTRELTPLQLRLQPRDHQ